MTTTPQTEAEQDVPLPDGFIMDGLPDGRIEYKRGFLRESDSLLRSCAPAWEARSIYRLHKELRRLDAESKQQRAALERKSEAIQKLWAERDQLRAQLSKAVAEEREACAKVCDDRYMGDNNREDMEAKRCAAAIRARSNT